MTLNRGAVEAENGLKIVEPLFITLQWRVFTPRLDIFSVSSMQNHWNLPNRSLAPSNTQKNPSNTRKAHKITSPIKQAFNQSPHNQSQPHSTVDNLNFRSNKPTRIPDSLPFIFIPPKTEENKQQQNEFQFHKNWSENISINQKYADQAKITISKNTHKKII